MVPAPKSTNGLEKQEFGFKKISKSAKNSRKRRADPVKRLEEYGKNNARRAKKRKTMTQQERKAVNAKRREARKKKKELESMSKLK